MKIVKSMIMAVVAAFALASCGIVEINDPDGKWPPMKWKSEVTVERTSNGIYSVPADGGEFLFSCSNYSGPWFSSALWNGEFVYPAVEEGNYKAVSADGFKAELQGNKLSVVFGPNTTGAERQLELDVTAGDIFHLFRFKQK